MNKENKRQDEASFAAQKDSQPWNLKQGAERENMLLQIENLTLNAKGTT